MLEISCMSYSYKTIYPFLVYFCAWWTKLLHKYYGRLSKGDLHVDGVGYYALDSFKLSIKSNLTGG
uniref:Uncharacterized protein n=1 Tax=Arundo donax TaxID=35708 RepID=A0A0A9CRB2_ARUDO